MSPRLPPRDQPLRCELCERGGPLHWDGTNDAWLCDSFPECERRRFDLEADRRTEAEADWRQEQWERTHTVKDEI